MHRSVLGTCQHHWHVHGPPLRLNSSMSANRYQILTGQPGTRETILQAILFVTSCQWHGLRPRLRLVRSTSSVRGPRAVTCAVSEFRFSSSLRNCPHVQSCPNTWPPPKPIYLSKDGGEIGPFSNFHRLHIGVLEARYHRGPVYDFDQRRSFSFR